MSTDTLYAQIAQSAIAESPTFALAVKESMESEGKIAKSAIRAAIVEWLRITYQKEVDVNSPEVTSLAGHYIQGMVQTGRYNIRGGFLVQNGHPANLVDQEAIPEQQVTADEI